MPKRFLFPLAIALPLLVSSSSTAQVLRAPSMQRTTVRSSIDGEEQPVRYWTPKSLTQETPILVSLHTWSSDYTQDRSPWLIEAVKRGWIYIQPNFRGRNDHPEACGSELARQDILDALDWALETFPVDRTRVYLAGVSGGGHMTMLMAGYHPDRFSAASAWVGISDLADWYRFHSRTGKPEKYARMIAACTGGRPGESTAIDDEYHSRSPINHLHRVGQLHLDLNSGINDGKSGSVPIHHTLRGFNKVAESHGNPVIPESEMDLLWNRHRLQNPQPSDRTPDPAYERKIYLRRTSKNTRVTIFDGGHEARPEAACAWLATKSRQTVTSVKAAPNNK